MSFPFWILLNLLPDDQYKKRRAFPCTWYMQYLWTYMQFENVEMHAKIRNKVIKKFYYKGRNISVYDYKSQPWLHLKNGGGIGTYITLTSEAPFI